MNLSFSQPLVSRLSTVPPPMLDYRRFISSPPFLSFSSFYFLSRHLRLIQGLLLNLGSETKESANPSSSFPRRMRVSLSLVF
jgi:hypothetical protein